MGQSRVRYLEHILRKVFEEILYCVCLRHGLAGASSAPIDSLLNMYTQMSPSGRRALRRHPSMLHGLHLPPEPRTSPELLS